MKEKFTSEIYVLDSTVFVNNTSYLFNDKICVTSPLIENEMKSAKSKIDFYRMTQHTLHIMMPSKHNIEKVKKKVAETKHKLSLADISIIALGLDLKDKGKKVFLVSDDYSIQDIAKRFNLKIISIASEGIKEHYNWKRICIACNRETSYNVCEICGQETLFVRVK